MVENRQLGQTGIEVTPIGLGVMQFAGGKGMFRMMFPHIPQQTKNDIVRAALDGGINWFDTAELYGRGRSERGLARALRAAGMDDDQVVVCTKWFPILRTAANIPRTIEHRLRFLEGYTIDLHMVHQPWGFSSPEAEMDAMADLVEGGKIRSVGVSNFNEAYMRRAHAALAKRGIPLAVNQVQYSLIHRQIESDGVLDAARELGVSIVAWSPFGSGILTGRFHREDYPWQQVPLGRRSRLRRQVEATRPLVNALTEIAEARDVTPAQVALNWLIYAQGDTVLAIPGASRAEQAQDNAAAMAFKLTEEERNRLDELSQHYR